jgi:hypothetical protein
VGSASYTTFVIATTQKMPTTSTLLVKLPALRDITRRLPQLSKILFWVLLLVNIRSLPFAWHSLSYFLQEITVIINNVWIPVRFFRSVLVIRVKYRVFRMRQLFKPRVVRAVETARWFESKAPIGLNPLEHVSVYKTWASACHFIYYILIAYLCMYGTQALTIVIFTVISATRATQR